MKSIAGIYFVACVVLLAKVNLRLVL